MQQRAACRRLSCASAPVPAHILGIFCLVHINSICAISHHAPTSLFLYRWQWVLGMRALVWVMRVQRHLYQNGQPQIVVDDEARTD